MCGVQLQLLFLSLFQSYDPLIVFQCLFLCNLQSCTLHNTLTVHDIFMQFYKNVYGRDDVLRAKMIAPLLLVFKLCPFDDFLFDFV